MTQPTGKKIGYIELENGGTIKIEFYPDSAPNTVANFEKLANSGFYNNLTFHRVEPGFASFEARPLRARAPQDNALRMT